MWSVSLKCYFFRRCYSTNLPWSEPTRGGNVLCRESEVWFYFNLGKIGRVILGDDHSLLRELGFTFETSSGRQSLFMKTSRELAAFGIAFQRRSSNFKFWINVRSSFSSDALSMYGIWRSIPKLACCSHGSFTEEKTLTLQLGNYCCIDQNWNLYYIGQTRVKRVPVVHI